MAILRFSRTFLGACACAVLLVMLWQIPEPWGSIGMIGMAPLLVIGFASLQELARKPVSRPYALAIGLGLVSPIMNAMMAPHAARWSGLMTAGLCAIAGVLAAFYRDRARLRL